MKQFTSLWLLVFFMASTVLFAQNVATGSANQNNNPIIKNLEMQQNLVADIQPGVQAGTPQSNGNNYCKYVSSDASRAVLWNNGSFVTSTGVGTGGSDYSVVQDVSLGMYVYGFSFQASQGNSLADDFVVTGTWNVQTITFFGYQTNSGILSPITDIRVQIYNGNPSTTGVPIWGDATTNRLISTEWTNTWRVYESSPLEMRPIMEAVADVSGLTLTAGTYWVKVTGNCPWYPPITILGETTTGNALQQSSSGWTSITDIGSQGIPFIIKGTTGGSIPDISVSPAELQQELEQAGMAEQYLAIANEGEGPLFVALSIDLQSKRLLNSENTPGKVIDNTAITNFQPGNDDGLDGNTSSWIRLDQYSLDVDPGSSETIAVTFDATGITPDVYTVNINITSNDPDVPLVLVPVTFTVIEILTLDTEFSAEPLSGIAPLTVDFTDLSTGSPISWQWDFDNDGTIDSEEQNPLWVYDEPGTYTIALNVSDGTNSDTETKQDYIVVNAPETGIINVVASQRTDGSKILDVQYDLYGGEPEYFVWLEVSFNDDNNYQVVNQVIGDTGWVAPAQNLQIAWDAGAEIPDGFYSKNIRVKVSADFSVASPPTVTTVGVSNITTTTAISGGNVTHDGGAAVTARGVVWGTLSNPTIGQNEGLTTDGEGLGEFVSNLTGLTPETNYFVRAYATNSEGTSYGDELSFTTTAAITCGENFTDTRDGKVYGTVQIDTQCWMKQNLNIGTRINGTSNQTNNGTIEKYCYNNSEANCDVYGGLYQWDEMMQYSTTPSLKGICPTDWHLPSDVEWTTLSTYLNTQQNYRCNSIASYVGKALASKTNWTTHSATCVVGNNLSTNNATGFTALPSGYRYNGSFYEINKYSYFRSSTVYDASNAWVSYLGYGYESINRTYVTKGDGNSVRCVKDETVSSVIPTVTTSPITNITQTTATCGGNVTEDGGAAVTACGVVWSTLSNPTVEQNQGMTTDGEGTGDFVSSLTGLSASTTYFIRAYAINSAGTSYGEELSFTTNSTTFVCGSDFTDSRDGKVYSTVQIGTQCWMKQNLNIGTRINGISNQTNNGTIEKYCYNNSESYCNVYGGLYQWNEAMNYSTTQGVQGICPAGWKLPMDAEWTTLTTFLGGQSVAGGKLKETGTTHWTSPNTGATNSSGFTALPGGFRDIAGTIGRLNSKGYWWSSSENDATYAWYRYLNYDNAQVGRSNVGNKPNGFSVRCLKDN